MKIVQRKFIKACKQFQKVKACKLVLPGLPQTHFLLRSVQKPNDRSAVGTVLVHVARKSRLGRMCMYSHCIEQTQNRHRRYCLTDKLALNS